MLLFWTDWTYRAKKQLVTPSCILLLYIFHVFMTPLASASEVGWSVLGLVFSSGSSALDGCWGRGRGRSRGTAGQGRRAAGELGKVKKKENISKREILQLKLI